MSNSQTPNIARAKFLQPIYSANAKKQQVFKSQIKDSSSPTPTREVMKMRLKRRNLKEARQREATSFYSFKEKPNKRSKLHISKDTELDKSFFNLIETNNSKRFANNLELIRFQGKIRRELAERNSPDIKPRSSSKTECFEDCPLSHINGWQFEELKEVEIEEQLSQLMTTLNTDSNYSKSTKTIIHIVSLISKMNTSLKPLFEKMKMMLVKHMLFVEKHFVERIKKLVSELSDRFRINEINYRDNFYLGMPKCEAFLHFLEFSETMLRHSEMDRQEIEHKKSEHDKQLSTLNSRFSEITKTYEQELSKLKALKDKEISRMKVKLKIIEEENNLMKKTVKHFDNTSFKEKTMTFKELYQSLNDTQAELITAKEERKIAEEAQNIAIIQHSSLGLKINELNEEISNWKGRVSDLERDIVFLKKERKDLLEHKANNSDKRMLRLLEIYGPIDTSSRSNFSTITFPQQAALIETGIKKVFRHILVELEDRDELAIKNLIFNLKRFA